MYGRDPWLHFVFGDGSWVTVVMSVRSFASMFRAPFRRVRPGYGDSPSATLLDTSVTITDCTCAHGLSSKAPSTETCVKTRTLNLLALARVPEHPYKVLS